MSYVFIGGIPASGKSYLAEKISSRTKAVHVDLDSLREEMVKDPKLKYWVNFYWNQNEEEYLRNTSCAEKWKNLIKQSEAFWPAIIKRISEVKRKYPSAIFESVNIVPHLASRDFDFPGVYLLGESFKQIFDRNKKSPRWGKTDHLQKLEAETFYYCERPNLKKEAKRYGFKTFTDPQEAEIELLKLL